MSRTTDLLIWSLLLAAVLALPFALQYGAEKEIDIGLMQSEGR